MSTHTEISRDEPMIVMTRVYDAPRELVWEAITQAKHVRQWWGGPGFSNPVCEMDVRVGGSWTHVMRFPDGTELDLDFIFLEVERPRRLVWQHRNYEERQDDKTASRMTVTLEDLGGKTRWTLVTRFRSIEGRDGAVEFGFTRPIEASNDRLTDYLKQMTTPAAQPNLSGIAMKLSMHSMTADSFVPMLTSLSEWLDKGFAQKGAGMDLVNARLAPDMFTLAQQVQQACQYATNGVACLCGRPALATEPAQTTPDGLKAQIARAIDLVSSFSASDFAGAEEGDCSIEIPGDRMIAMDGYRFLVAWSLPHFYFHVVTAYDILRHSGVAIGKFDYLSQVGAFIRPKAM